MKRFHVHVTDIAQSVRLYAWPLGAEPTPTESDCAKWMLDEWATKLGKNVRGFSGGSTPSGRIHPLTLEVLGKAGIDVSDFRSKSWDEFSADGAPKLSIVVTVCDDAAAEPCPVFALPLTDLDRARLQEALIEIGRS